MTAALDQVVANALGLKSVNNCEKWKRAMDEDDDTQVYKKPWVGLTDEDCKGMSAGDRVLAMWADRTLKEKST